GPGRPPRGQRRRAAAGLVPLPRRRAPAGPAPARRHVAGGHFGPGDWRTRTEDRPPPPPVAAGDRLPLGPDLVAEVLEVRRPRLVRIAFDKTGAALWRAPYRLRRPVQYARVAGPLQLWRAHTRVPG